MRLKKDKDTEPLQPRTTRIFAIKWDNSRFTTLSDKSRLDVKEADGVHFANGLVCLSNGVVYEGPNGMDRLQSHFNISGYYLVSYQDGESLTNEGSVDRSPRQPVKKARRA
jgi:hypothetical protein